VSRTAILLVLSSCAYAVIHALIPDHWLPFVLLARSQAWSARRLAGLAALAGLLHAGVSTLVALAAIVLGRGGARNLAERSGQSLEFLSGALLMLFGLGYGIIAHFREARAHRNGSSRAPHAAKKPHAHGHLLQGWLGGSLSGAALVAVVGISPCALLIPVLFTASTEGPGTAMGAVTGFTTCTVVTMVLVTLIASRLVRATRGARRVDLPLVTRYGDLTSGLLIAVIGVCVMLLAR